MFDGYYIIAWVLMVSLEHLQDCWNQIFTGWRGPKALKCQTSVIIEDLRIARKVCSLPSTNEMITFVK